jgi:hypothetical protein
MGVVVGVCNSKTSCANAALDADSFSHFRSHAYTLGIEAADIAASLYPTMHEKCTPAHQLLVFLAPTGESLDFFSGIALSAVRQSYVLQRSQTTPDWDLLFKQIALLSCDSLASQDA